MCTIDLHPGLISCLILRFAAAILKHDLVMETGTSLEGQDIWTCGVSVKLPPTKRYNMAIYLTI